MTDLPSSDKTLNTSSSTSPPSTTTDQPAAPLSRNSSFSKLNAKAPEFVPMKSPSPPPQLTAVAVTVPDPRLMVVSPPHVFPSSPLPMPIPVRTPPPFPPHLHHHHHDQHHPQHRHNNNNNNHNNNNSTSNNNNQGHNSNVNNRHHQKNHDKKEQDDKDRTSSTTNNSNNNNNNNGLSDEATQKLINQVEYYFSDVNLATTEHLIRFIFKDPEGFVPVTVVASFKKIKALISSNSQLAAVLRNSTKLVVSDDGKKVKRLHGLTTSDMEELQARIIVAENLPEDHCHQNLMKIFSVVGSVKSIRTCQPQPSNNVASPASRSSKNEVPYSSKLHAFVEYDSVELAEKAIAELNNEDSWRNGLRVRPLHKQVLKPAQGRTKKAGNESEEDVSTSDLNQNEKQSEDHTAEPDVHSHEQREEQSLEKEGGQKKSRNRNKGKGRGRGHNNNHNQNLNHHHHQTGRGSHMSNSVNGEPPVVGKQPPGPRMPDGTRGFSLGRGRPLTVNTAA